MVQDIVATLNPRQRAAVELAPVNALILAGAGSGKTKVLTTRIAWLMARGVARPFEILAVTFTNKAAREMRTRLGAMVPMDIGQMWMGTFHGLAHRLLRLHNVEANLPKTFQIIDQSDQLSLIKRIMKDAGIDPEARDPRNVQAMIN
ncbi:MAG: UvrD-helicase domain-containing protein, partial [Duodenibacillus sp.]